MPVERLLLESGDYLLLETGDRLLLESSTAGGADVLCTLALTDATDTVAASATAAIVAALSITDAADTLAALAEVSQPDAPEVVSLGGRSRWQLYDDVPHWAVVVKASVRDEDDRVASAATMGAGPVWAGLSLVDGNDALRASYRIDWPAATLRRSPRAKLIRQAQ